LTDFAGASASQASIAIQKGYLSAAQGYPSLITK
jgi:hypothetical protein